MQEAETQKHIDISGIEQTELFGASDRWLRRIADQSGAKITVRGADLILSGPDAEVAALEKLFTELILVYHRNQKITDNDVDTVIAVIRKQIEPDALRSQNGDYEAVLFTKDAAIRPRTPGQQQYVELVRENDLVFAIGPAGTGKTYLAVAMAVAHLRDKQVSKIILARPAVEAGESLGYLPGDMLEKVDPYLRPLYDALGDMIQSDKLQRYLETRVIEVAPLAYMRGRTLNNAFIILDEAQNTTPAQMKMLLTRIGINSRAIVTGDITQVDLGKDEISGLAQVQSVLANVPGIAFLHLNEQDVVRHRLVRDIIKAYDRFNQPRKQS